MPTEIIPLEQPLKIATDCRKVSLGILGSLHCGDRRVALTPEGAAQLCEQGVSVRIEEGAGASIHYSDEAYRRAGAEVTSRSRTLESDLVVCTSLPTAEECRRLRPGSLLVTLSKRLFASSAETARALLTSHANVIAADLIVDGHHHPVADILHEIDGCASMSIASAMLSDPVGGKGILLGGVTGIVPCEVTVIGSGMGAIAAAHNALGCGATVRMFDNDLYSLRNAGRVLDHRIIASSLHPKVLTSALKSADIVVVTPTSTPYCAGIDALAAMKSRALVFDLTSQPGVAFAGLPLVDLVLESPTVFGGACYCNVGGRVPRTAAMALSNLLTGFYPLLAEAQASPVTTPAPIRSGLTMLCGRCLNAELAAMLGTPLFDLNLLGN